SEGPASTAGPGPSCRRECQPLSSVRVQCPHCRSVCQVQPQQFGATVKCGKCAQPFALPAAPGVPAAAAAPPKPAASAPAVVAAPPPAPPTPNVHQEVVTQEVDTSLGSGIWKGLQSLYHALKGPAAPAPAPASR